MTMDKMSCSQMKIKARIGQHMDKLRIDIIQPWMWQYFRIQQWFQTKHYVPPSIHRYIHEVCIVVPGSSGI